MNWEVYYLCQKIARQGGTITYQDLGKVIGLNMADPRDRDAIAAILGDISTYEHARGRPLLSAVVVKTDANRIWPGGGFFNLATGLGLLPQKGNKEMFYAEELQRVYEYWKQH